MSRCIVALVKIGSAPVSVHVERLLPDQRYFLQHIQSSAYALQLMRRE